MERGLESPLDLECRGREENVYLWRVLHNIGEKNCVPLAIFTNKTGGGGAIGSVLKGVSTKRHRKVCMDMRRIHGFGGKHCEFDGEKLGENRKKCL